MFIVRWWNEIQIQNFKSRSNIAVSVLYRATPTVTRDIRYNGHLRGPVTLTPIAELLAVELCFYD